MEVLVEWIDLWGAIVCSKTDSGQTVGQSPKT
jgi:hypothetical protein